MKGAPIFSTTRRASRFLLARIFLRHTNASMWRAVLTDPNKRRRKLASQIFSRGPFLRNRTMLAATK